jgi:hypothetical protein
MLCKRHVLRKTLDCVLRCTRILLDQMSPHPHHITPHRNLAIARSNTQQNRVFICHTSKGTPLTPLNGHVVKPAWRLYVQTSTPDATGTHQDLLAKHHDARQAVSPKGFVRLYARNWIVKRNWPAINSKFSLAMPLSVRRLPLEDRSKFSVMALTHTCTRCGLPDRVKVKLGVGREASRRETSSCL